MLWLNIGKAPWHKKERYICLNLLACAQQCTAKFSMIQGYQICFGKVPTPVSRK